MKVVHINDVNEFLQDSNEDKGQYGMVYRGEFAKYPSRRPLLWRYSEAERQIFMVRNFGITRTFMDLIILPKIKYSYGIPLYNGGFLGDIDLCHSIGEPDLRQIGWQIMALLQHYGHPTGFLDITFSRKVAIFFACLDPASQKIQRSGYGYVYCWSRDDFCRKFGYKLILTKLMALTSFLNSECLSSTTRPE